MTSKRLLSGLLRGALPLLLLAACQSDEPARVPTLEEQVGVRKRRMLQATEQANQAVLAYVGREIDRVREGFFARLDRVEVAPELEVIDDVLEQFGCASATEYRATIDRYAEETLAHLDLLLDESERRLWAIAAEAGRREKARSLNYRAGYAELDEKVEATMAQLRQRANLEGVEQAATMLAFHRVEMTRVVKEDLEGSGQLLQFLSPPEQGYAPNRQETLAIVFCFIRKELEASVPLRFVQAVHHRMERGGIVIIDTPWELDPGLPNRAGELPLRAEFDDPRYLVSDLFRPVVDQTVSGFSEFRDFDVVSDYRTGLQRTDTGEFLAAVAWQISWNVNTHNRLVIRKKPESLPRLTGSEVLKKLCAEPPPSAEEGRQQGNLDG